MLFASFLCSAQFIQNIGITADKADFEMPEISNQKSLPIWEVTFEEETPVWTFGAITGTKTWAVGDTTPTNGYLYQGNPAPPLWWYMGQRYVKDFSVSGNNFAYIDGVSDLLGLFPTAVCESYILFDNIDLVGTLHPKLSFYQNYKGFNFDQCFVDFSNDNGLTWISVELNTEVQYNTYGSDFEELFVPSELIGGTDLAIRFRWNCPNDDPESGMGYGWQIDDVVIRENPDYELQVVDGRVNFFNYVDYTQPGNEMYFHYSSQYGQIPVTLFQSEDANIWFNVMVKNNGNLEVSPLVNISVFDPEMNEIFNYSSTIETEVISVSGLDTVDMNIQDFHPGNNPSLGLYTVVMSVSADGQTDGIPENNYFTSYFYVTENIYSRALNEPEGEIGLYDFPQGGVDGERMGTLFTFFQDTEISSLDVYIGESSELGAAYVAQILVYHQGVGDWIYVNVSDLIEIQEGDPGSWMNITFPDPAIIEIPEGDNAIEILIALEFYYQSSENAIRIGVDNDLQSGKWGGMYYIVDESTWYSGGWDSGGLCMSLNLNNSTQICPEDLIVCTNDVPFALEDGSCPSCEYSGQGVVENWFYPEVAGPGTHVITYTFNGNGFQCNFNITVNQTPELKTVTNTPTNGILQPGNMGTISILESDSETLYYVTKNNIEVTELISGNGAELVLGDQFTQGAYQVWATNSASCRIPLEIINFVDNTGTAKIVVSVDYGENPILLNGNDVVVSLYNQITEGEETVITLNSTLQPGESGQVIFDDLAAGTYFVSSSIDEFSEVDLNENVFYDNVLIFDDATPIEIIEGQIVFVEISHEQELLVEGSNEGTGTVGEQPEGKSLNPLEGKTVVLVNADTEEIIDIALTDENGNYTFPAIPDNTNIQIFVTMPESPVWTAYSAETQTNQTLEVDFIVSGNSVYPSTSKISNILTTISNVEIYPNPVAEILNIKSENIICKALIYDLSGRMLTSVTGENISGISTQDISAGSYLLICVDELGTPFVNKFVKE